MDPPSLMASKPDEELGSLQSSDSLIQIILLCVRSVAQLTRYIEQIIEQERVWGEDLAQGLGFLIYLPVLGVPFLSAMSSGFRVDMA